MNRGLTRLQVTPIPRGTDRERSRDAEVKRLCPLTLASLLPTSHPEPYGLPSPIP